MAERDYIDELEEHSYKLWKLKEDLRKLVEEMGTIPRQGEYDTYWGATDYWREKVEKLLEDK